MTKYSSVIIVASILQLCTAGEVFKRFRLGTSQGIVVSDGPVLFHNNPFLVPDEIVRASYERSGRKIHPITLQQNVLFVDLHGVGRVMIDAGSRGDQPSEYSPNSGALFDNMKAAGISPESVDVILLTHGHLDHTNGIRAVGGGRAFPNAKVFISAWEHIFWSNPPLIPNATDTSLQALEFFSSVYKNATEAYKGRLHLVTGNSSPLPGIRFIPTPGHSPGQCAIEITCEGERLLAVGDTWVSREDQLQNPEWEFQYETSRRSAFFSRLFILSLAEKRGDLVLAYHEKFPGLGYISSERNRTRLAFDWVPARI